MNRLKKRYIFVGFLCIFVAKLSFIFRAKGPKGHNGSSAEKGKARCLFHHGSYFPDGLFLFHLVQFFLHFIQAGVFHLKYRGFYHDFHFV